MSAKLQPRSCERDQARESKEVQGRVNSAKLVCMAAQVTTTINNQNWVRAKPLEAQETVLTSDHQKVAGGWTIATKLHKVARQHLNTTVRPLYMQMGWWLFNATPQQQQQQQQFKYINLFENKSSWHTVYSSWNHRAAMFHPQKSCLIVCDRAEETIVNINKRCAGQVNDIMASPTTTLQCHKLQK